MGCRQREGGGGGGNGLFTTIMEELNAGRMMDKLWVLGGHTLIALDGTEYFNSRQIKCTHCSTRKRSDGGTGHFHQILATVVVTPDRNLALPLSPEFQAPRKGDPKQDCARKAAKRWLALHGPACASLHPIYLGDELYACQPLCEAIQSTGGHLLLSTKQSSHKPCMNIWME